MRVAVVGRSEFLYDSAVRIAAAGHEIALVVTAKEAPEYRVTAEDFEKFAAAEGAPFIRTARIETIGDRVKALAPIDIAISVNYPGIVPQSVIDCFRLGMLNAHAGDLPRYRGNAPLAWAILAGEPRIGLCVHHMVGGELDSGDIVSRDYRAVGERTRIGDLWDWMVERTPHLFEEALARLDRDPDWVLERQSGNPADALRCYPRRPEDGRVRWDSDPTDILRLINASGRPFAGAFCRWKGEELRLLEAEPVDDGEIFLAIPGQVTAIGPGHADVATGGGGKIRITCVRAGDVEGPPDRFIRSIRERLE